MLTNAIRQVINTIADDVVTWRRQIHQHPELGFAEYQTAKLVADLLKQWGYRIQAGVGGTGVVACLPHKGDFTVGLRFDMDALPMEEESDLPYKSQNPGVMHACGHDGHVAIGLGTAYVLAKLYDFLPGRVKLIFQPAEEGGGGAQRLVKEGALLDPTVDAIVGLHIWPEINAGKIGVKKGPIMAAADRFDLVIEGKGGHGGLPHQATDPIVVGAEVINGLQSIVSREVPPTQPVVITVGTVHGGTAFNVIPARVEMSGTIRTIEDSLRGYVLRRLEQKARAYAAAAGASCNLKVEKCFATTSNDRDLVEVFCRTVNQTWGPETLVELELPSMTSEDFSEYHQTIPGLYFFLGTRNEEKGIIYPIHHSKYNIDESVLPFGVEVLANTVVTLLDQSCDKRRISENAADSPGSSTDASPE